MKQLMTEWRHFLKEEQDPLAPLANKANPRFADVIGGIVVAYLVPLLGDYVKEIFFEVVTDLGLDNGRKYLAKEIFQHFLKKPDSPLGRFATVQGLRPDPLKIKETKDLDQYINSVIAEIDKAENPFSIDVNEVFEGLSNEDLGDQLYDLRHGEYKTWDLSQFLWQVQRDMNLTQSEDELYDIYMDASRRRRK